MAGDQPDWTTEVVGSVTIDTGGGAVQVDVTAATTLDVAIQNATLAVTQSGGWTMDVSGTVDVAIQNATLSVTQSGAWSITITGTATVEFAAAQEVFFTATGPVTVENFVVPGTEAVFLGYADATIANLAAGASTIDNYTPGDDNPAIGVYDGILVVWQSKNGYAYAWHYPGAGGVVYVNSNSTTGGASPIFDNVFVDASTVAVGVVLTNTPAAAQNSDTYTLGYFGPALFPAPSLFGSVVVQLTNASGGTIVSDTVRIWTFGIKAQISNPTGGPANMQPGAGSFDSIATFTQTVPPNGVNVSLYGSGGQARSIHLVISVSETSAGSDVLHVTMGGVDIARYVVQVSSGLTDIMDIPISTAGATIGAVQAYAESLLNGASWSVSGFVTLANSTPPSRVGSTV